MIYNVTFISVLNCLFKTQNVYFTMGDGRRSKLQNNYSVAMLITVSQTGSC